MRLYGGIEAGGTKWVCAVGTCPDDLVVEEFATAGPDETIERALEFFRSQAQLEAIGIGSFGPVDLDRRSQTYGYITTTPKPGWAFTDLAGRVERMLSVPVSFDTDVNAAAWGEHRWGAARGLENFVYLTIGTGIGGGGLINGRLMHGLVHPEMGHLLLPRDAAADPFPGICPYHGDCLEGLASGPAIERRWGVPGGELADDHPAWALEAGYLACALVNIICTLSPERIILGGGVMRREHLFPAIRRQVRERLNGYVQNPAIIERIDDYIVPPLLGHRAGVAGAMALAGAGQNG